MPEAAVLITRPEPGAGQTAARVAALGYRPVVVPLQTVTPLPARLPPPDRVAAIVLTSGNAVPPLPAAYRVLPVWAVGRATAALAAGAGFTQVHSADGDAAALAGHILGDSSLSARPLLLVTGRGHGDPLCTALRQGGRRVIRRVVYATRPAAVLPAEATTALRAGATVLLFSAEAARVLDRLVRRAGLQEVVARCAAVVISPAVAAAAGDTGWAGVHVAARPDQDALLAALAATSPRTGSSCRAVAAGSGSPAGRTSPAGC